VECKIINVKTGLVSGSDSGLVQNGDNATIRRAIESLITRLLSKVSPLSGGGSQDESSKGTGTDIYAITGDSKGGKVFWKNGMKCQPFASDGNSIRRSCNVGGDVYELSTDQSGVAFTSIYGYYIMKNGHRHWKLHTRDAHVDCWWISGKDVYFGGRLEGKSTVWKNGKVLYKLDDYSVLEVFVQ
jgi:hypothetical protein